MNLQPIKDFFTCQANAEQKRLRNLEAFQKQYHNVNLFSLFKTLSFASAPELNDAHLKKFLSTFTGSLQIVQPNELKKYSKTKQFPHEKDLTQQEIKSKGIKLFLNVWGNQTNSFTFSEFSKFMNKSQSLPEKASQIPYIVKKKLFQLIESEIQNLLNIETIRQICLKQYKNVSDLFQTIADQFSNQITLDSIKKLYLMHSERMNQQFFEYLNNRLSLPIQFQDFLKIFKKNEALSKKTAERKIHYSSARRKKHDNQVDFFDEQQSGSLNNSRASFGFQTPKTHKVNIRNATSTKLTKGQKIQQLKQASVNISRFSLSQSPSVRSAKKIEILGQILAIQQEFIQLKRNLVLRKDFDLELVYERQGQKFEELLNHLYGVCNFTAFVRFIVPQDFEHKYLAFIRYQTKDTLSDETLDLIDELFDAYRRKEQRISQLWQKIDKQMVFRLYCTGPKDNNIPVTELNKYFSQRECNILLDRMDPLNSGQITLENFN